MFKTNEQLTSTIWQSGYQSGIYKVILRHKQISDFKIASWMQELNTLLLAPYSSIW